MDANDIQPKSNVRNTRLSESVGDFQNRSKETQKIKSPSAFTSLYLWLPAAGHHVMSWCNDEEPQHVELVGNIVIFHFILFLMLCVFFATIYFFYKNDTMAKKPKYSFLFSQVLGIVWIGWEALCSWMVQVYGLAFSSSFCTLRLFILAVVPGYYYNSIFLFLFFRLKQTFEGSSLSISNKQSYGLYAALIIPQLMSNCFWAYQSTLGCPLKVTNSDFEEYIPQGAYIFARTLCKGARPCTVHMP